MTYAKLNFTVTANIAFVHPSGFFQKKESSYGEAGFSYTSNKTRHFWYSEILQNILPWKFWDVSCESWKCFHTE